VTLGFPRAKELFDATENPSNPTCNIYFTHYNKSPSELHRVADKICQVTVDELLSSWEVISSDSYRADWWLPVFLKLYGSTTTATGNDNNNNDTDSDNEEETPIEPVSASLTSSLSTTLADNNSTPTLLSQVVGVSDPAIVRQWWCLRLRFNTAKLFKSGITTRSIAEQITKHWDDLRAVWSPLAIGVIDVWADCSRIEEAEAVQHSGGAVGRRTGAQGDFAEADANDCRRFYMMNVVSPEIRSKLAGGVAGIYKLYPRKIASKTYGAPLKPAFLKKLESAIATTAGTTSGDNTTATTTATAQQPAEEWIVDTDGTSLQSVLQLPHVDATRTLTNNFWEFFELFGIEAARSYLIMEFFNIITAGGSSAGINQNHVKILVDKMTYTGSIRSVARHGVEEAQYGPITRASFEEVMPNMVNGALYSEEEPLNGISSNVALGKLIAAGTGLVTLRPIEIRVKGARSPGARSPGRGDAPQGGGYGYGGGGGYGGTGGFGGDVTYHF